MPPREGDRLLVIGKPLLAQLLSKLPGYSVDVAGFDTFAKSGPDRNCRAILLDHEVQELAEFSLDWIVRKAAAIKGAQRPAVAIAINPRQLVKLSLPFADPQFEVAKGINRPQSEHHVGGIAVRVGLFDPAQDYSDSVFVEMALGPRKRSHFGNDVLVVDA
ncbi:hypothetical protein ACO2I3_15640 [Leptospira interrogans]